MTNDQVEDRQGQLVIGVRFQNRAGDHDAARGICEWLGEWLSAAGLLLLRLTDETRTELHRIAEELLSSHQILMEEERDFLEMLLNDGQPDGVIKEAHWLGLQYIREQLRDAWLDLGAEQRRGRGVAAAALGDCQGYEPVLVGGIDDRETVVIDDWDDEDDEDQDDEDQDDDAA